MVEMKLVSHPFIQQTRVRQHINHSLSSAKFLFPLKTSLESIPTIFRLQTHTGNNLQELLSEYLLHVSW